MKIVPFPRSEHEPRGRSPETEIETALCGGGTGAEADSWRELREDVRCARDADVARVRARAASACSSRPASPAPGAIARVHVCVCAAPPLALAPPASRPGSARACARGCSPARRPAPSRQSSRSRSSPRGTGRAAQAAVAEDAQSSAKAGNLRALRSPGTQPRASVARPGPLGAEAPAVSQRLRPFARPTVPAATAGAAGAGSAAAQAVEPFVGGYGSNGASAGTNGRVAAAQRVDHARGDARRACSGRRPGRCSSPCATAASCRARRSRLAAAARPVKRASS